MESLKAFSVRNAPQGSWRDFNEPGHFLWKTSDNLRI